MFPGAKRWKGSQHITLLTFPIRFFRKLDKKQRKNVIKYPEDNDGWREITNIGIWSDLIWLAILMDLKIRFFCVLVKVMISLIKQACLQTSVLTHQNLRLFVYFQFLYGHNRIHQVWGASSDKVWFTIIFKEGKF